MLRSVFLEVMGGVWPHFAVQSWICLYGGVVKFTSMGMYFIRYSHHNLHIGHYTLMMHTNDPREMAVHDVTDSLLYLTVLRGDFVLFGGFEIMFLSQKFLLALSYVILWAGFHSVVLWSTLGLEFSKHTLDLRPFSSWVDKIIWKL